LLVFVNNIERNRQIDLENQRLLRSLLVSKPRVPAAQIKRPAIINTQFPVIEIQNQRIKQKIKSLKSLYCKDTMIADFDKHKHLRRRISLFQNDSKDSSISLPAIKSSK
jgi:hypothetical protein